MELELVEELRRVTTHEIQQARRPFDRVLPGAREVEPARQPARLVGEVLEQHRPALGDRIVAEAFFLHRELACGVCEVLRVAALVEERPPVVRAADRLDHEDDAVRDLDRRAERAWALVRSLVEIEGDVLLRAQVDPQILERAFECGDHPVRREHRIPLGRPE